MKIVARILKILCYTLIFGVMAFLIGRIVIADYYPGAMKALYKTEAMRATATANGEVEIRRQDLRASYDNPDFAYFMADHQYYCPETGELQITIRYNINTLEELQRDYGLEQTPADIPDLFSYSLVGSHISDDNGNRLEEGIAPATVETERRFMYRYVRLTFNNVSFGEEVGWYRVEITYTGEGEPDGKTAEERWPAMIAVWEREMMPYDKTSVLSEKDF
ncbi:MAG: hypothetical protein IJ012_00235 [Clostridia bacterium]|nr:hypothetical protein [Clostridia bacterium]